MNQLEIPQSVFKILFNTLPFGVDVVDENLKIKYMNKLFFDAFGSKAINKTCYEVYRDNGQQCEHCPLKSSIKVGETRTLETDGVAGRKSFLISHTGIEVERKKMILEIFIDITEKRERIAELEEFISVTVNRELKMTELKEKIEKLASKSKK